MVMPINFYDAIHQNATHRNDSIHVGCVYACAYVQYITHILLFAVQCFFFFENLWDNRCVIYCVYMYTRIKYEAKQKKNRFS